MKKQTLIWLLIFICSGGFLVFRATSHGMGEVYTQTVKGNEAFVPPREIIGSDVHLNPFRTMGVWIAAGLTLCIFSFLYKDNPFYKFAESILIGISAAYWMVVGVWTVMVPNLFGKIAPITTAQIFTPGTISAVEYYYYIPLVLGIMLIWRLAPRGGWIARWPLALIIGTTAGMRLVVYFESDFLSQINHTILPLLVATSDKGMYVFDWVKTLKNWTVLIGVLTTTIYFFFSAEHTGVLKPVSRVGIWFLMITFGAAFGNTVMGRITLLSQRFEFLLDDWLWIIDPLSNRLGM
ncbi:hypothetical protein MNBD_PLANCTO02-420 [hydrothermal vent metagenome]|uniref:Uncharacterized protein n=1 Tax=hydrothermal vent metagenome TaxID=652676 RepID=A0A3B1DSN8_9ZZZZ